MKAILNGRIVAPGGVRSGVLLFEGGKIKEIADRVPEGAEIIDAQGNYVSPGFIDIHVHGAGNADFMDNTAEAYLTVARTHARYGTTLLFPTTLTCTSRDRISA